MVVNASGTPFVFPENQAVEVQVTGQVRRFVLAEINRDYNLGLQPDLYREFESRPAIVAQAIALAPTPGQISQNPSQYYGKTIAVTGEVEDIKSPNSFTLDEDQLFGAQDLLVEPQIASDQLRQEAEGSTVRRTRLTGCESQI